MAMTDITTAGGGLVGLVAEHGARPAAGDCT